MSTNKTLGVTKYPKIYIFPCLDKKCLSSKLNGKSLLRGVMDGNGKKICRHHSAERLQRGYTSVCCVGTVSFL